MPRSPQQARAFRNQALASTMVRNTSARGENGGQESSAAHAHGCACRARRSGASLHGSRFAEVVQRCKHIADGWLQWLPPPCPRPDDKPGSEARCSWQSCQIAARTVMALTCSAPSADNDALAAETDHDERCAERDVNRAAAGSSNVLASAPNRCRMGGAVKHSSTQRQMLRRRPKLAHEMNEEIFFTLFDCSLARPRYHTAAHAIYVGERHQQDVGLGQADGGYLQGIARSVRRKRCHHVGTTVTKAADDARNRHCGYCTVSALCRVSYQIVHVPYFGRLTIVSIEAAGQPALR